MVSFTHRLLYPQGKRAWCPLDRRLDGPQRRSGRGGEEKNSQPLPGPEPPDHPARSPELYHSTIPAIIPTYKVRISSLYMIGTKEILEHVSQKTGAS
jgi:hypothetical protein